jgi:hypothetical protein
MLKSFRTGLVLAVVSSAAARAQAPEGPEFQVNTYTTNNQNQAAVASDANGNFVVVWQSSGGQDGDGNGIFGQRYNAAGTAVGAEFQVNTYTTGDQMAPDVASDPSGNFVVVWQSQGPDGSVEGIAAQRYDALGTPQGTEFIVNAYTLQDQSFPSVASDANGNFVVVWNSSFQEGLGGIGIIGRRFSASGVALGGDFHVNSYTTGSQVLPTVASAPKGNFLVAWTSQTPQDGSGSAVMAQRFDAAGAAQGGEFRVNSYTTAYQFSPRATADGSGNFVVVWGSGFGQDGSDSGIFSQRIDAAGAFQGPEFQVNTYTTSGQTNPDVSASADGTFVVAWHSFNQDGPSYGVFARRFDAAGSPQSGEFRVNSYTPGYQANPAVSMSGNGDFRIVWRAELQDGSGGGVFGQRYGDLIFADGFDSGTLSRWSSTSIGGGDLSVVPEAAMPRSFAGLQAIVNDRTPLYVQDDTPNSESRYRVRFYVNTNDFDPGESAGHFRARLFLAQGSGVRLATIVLKRQLGAYSVEARVRQDSGARVDTGFFPLNPGAHHLEFDWQRSTAPGASNGSFELWIDGVSAAILPGLDNDQAAVEQGRMGALSLKAGVSGSLFFDQFESRRRVFIGP